MLLLKSASCVEVTEGPFIVLPAYQVEISAIPKTPKQTRLTTTVTDVIPNFKGNLLQGQVAKVTIPGRNTVLITKVRRLDMSGNSLLTHD